MRINYISNRGQPTRGGPPAWGLGEVLTTPACKKKLCQGTLTCGILVLEAKQSGGKLLPHSDLRWGGGGGSVSKGSIAQRTKRDDQDGYPGGGMWVYGLDWAGPG